jgi:hypothetical protein
MSAIERFLSLDYYGAASRVRRRRRQAAVPLVLPVVLIAVAVVSFGRRTPSQLLWACPGEAHHSELVGNSSAVQD